MNRNTSLSIRNIVLILVVAGIVALALSGYLTPLGEISLRPFVDVQGWIYTRFQAVSDFLSAPRDVADLRQRNNELEAEVARLQAEIIQLQQQNTEIQILSALVDFARANPAYDYLGANVIGRDPSPFLHYIIINRGSDEGLRRGMPVVTSQGLVGRVSAVTAGAARVQLITDPSSVVNVRIQGTNDEAVIEGSLTGEVTLNLIPQETDLQSGGLVLTSGLGGNYPPNVLIGQITSVRSRSFDLFQRASIQPSVDFSNLEIVLVIQNFRPVDITPLIPETSP